jgi:hypothetical protein
MKFVWTNFEYLMYISSSLLFWAPVQYKRLNNHFLLSSIVCEVYGVET